MRFLVEFDPPAEVKNDFELNPELQKKVGKAMENMEPVSAWFTLRHGFIVLEADSGEELSRKLAPIFHLFKTDVEVSPAYSLEEFPKLVASIGEEAKKYV